MRFFVDYAGCTENIWNFVEEYSDTSSANMNLIQRFMGLAGQVAWVSVGNTSYLNSASRLYFPLATS